MSKLLKQTVIAGLIITGSAFSQVLYNVSGIVLLEDSVGVGSHGGVKVKLYNLPSMDPEDSTYSQATGFYSINISPGYYLVEWTRDGYVPWELGGLSLAENTVLDTVILIPGEVMEVTGNVSGTWTTSYVYHVMSNITVPAGDSLTINPGVRVKFAAGTGMTCNGKLKALGTADEHVLFTSKEPTPLPGDWTNLTLNTSHNTLQYIDYEWAVDGIIGTGYNGHTKIDHLTINGTLSLTANGIYINNGDHLTITNNYLAVAGEFGIFVNDGFYSEFLSNTIITPTNGIKAETCTECLLDGNIITTGDNTTGPDYAINTNGSQQITITNNQIVADEYGISSPNSYKAQIKNNHITGRIYWCGIQFTDSDSSLVYKNHVTRTAANGNTSSWQYLLNGKNSAGSIIRKDTLICVDFPDNYRENLALRCEWSLVDSNYIKFRHSYHTNYTIYDDYNSDIINNEMIVLSNTYGNSNAIRSYSDGDHINRIEYNLINLDYLSRDRFDYAIWTQNNTIVRNNDISCDYLERAIYVQNNCIVDSNTISGDYSSQGTIHIDGNSVTVNDNIVTNTGSGTAVYSQGHTEVEIHDNHFENTNTAQWITLDNTDAAVHHNLVELNSGRGAEYTNQSSGSIYNNTIISGNGGDYGVHLSNQTNIPVYNNIVQGFQNGVYAENTIQNYNLDHNDLYDISGSLFSGSAIPPLAGQIIDENANGDPADIYNNISLNPQYINPDSGDYGLQLISPCINAGTENLTDPDGTVSDIGAFPRFIYIVIDHEPLSSTVDTTGPYEVRATVTSTINTALDVTLYYSTDGGSNYTSIAMSPDTGDVWTGNIPGQSLNTTIHYYLLADDGPHEVTSPFNIANDVYSFYVTLFDQFANLGGSSDTFGDIHLNWTRPTLISGTLSELRLYRALSPNVSLTAANLYQTFHPDTTQYIDTDVSEGNTYYYRLTGLVDLNGDVIESVVSSEVAVTSDDATVVRVRGVAQLESQSDHSGTKVLFEKTSPSAVTDSTLTDSSGYYDIIVVTGIYNAHFTHDGYQPQLVGHQFFSGNALLDSLTLVPGGVVSLAGETGGTLTSNNLYFIDDNVTIPYGDTLVIEAGTEVLFRGNYSLTANGKLLVNGTPENKVLFSSRLPVPAVGDWQNITLNSGAGGSVIKYAIYRYATNGFVCNNLDSLTIWGCELNTLAINARAITLNNCENVDIRYNTLNVPGDWVIYKDDNWDNSGVFVGNDIQAANSGMYLRYYHNLTVDSNSVQTTGTGIRTQDSQNLVCRHNTITGQDHSIGFHAYNCDGAVFTDNVVRGARDYGYYLNQAQNVTFNKNKFYYSGNNSWVRGVQGENGNGSEYENNTIIFSDSLGQNYDWYGFYEGDQSTYKNNYVHIWKNSHGNNSAFREIHNSTFIDNDIYLQARGGNDWQRTGLAGNNNTSINDTLYIGYETQGYYGNAWTIRGSVIHAINGNNEDVAIDCRGGELNLTDVKIINCREGIYGTGTGGTVKNTLIDVYGSNYGVKFENNSTMELYQNTIAGNNAGTGIWTTTNATVLTNSNIVDGFATGLNAESPNTVQTSLFYNNGTNFTGAELPPQIGDVVTVNANADPSDIYGNILLDPQFVNADTGNYHLGANSPAINAGDIDSLDADGTVADMGAFFYNFGFVPENLTVVNTGDGFVTIDWDIVETDSIQHFIPYYKLTTADTWTQVSTTTDTFCTFSGLTNNTAYHFAVSVQYPSHETVRSRSITAKPGLAQIVLSTEYIVSERDVNVVDPVAFDLQNTGSKDLEFSITAPGNLNISQGTVIPSGSTTIIDTLQTSYNTVHADSIVIASNDLVNPVSGIQLLSIVGNYAAVPASYFSPPAGGSDTFTVVISYGHLDGSTLQSGDEIGVFDGNTCVGAGIMTGQFPYVIRCYGYTPGDSLSIRVYDYSQAREIEAQFNRSAGALTFVNNGFSYGSISGSIYRDQSVGLNANMFNLISLNVYPRYPNMNQIYGALDSLEIVYNDQGQAYIPRYGINSIGSHTLVDGYHVFTRDQHPELTVSGLPINTGDYPVTVEAHRFNSIAYLSDSPLAVETALVDLSGLIEIVQDDAGGVYIPDLSVNTLGNMSPGKGYQIFTNVDTNVTFVYPDGSQQVLARLDSGIETPEKSSPPGRYASVPRSGLPYTIIIDGLVIDEHVLQPRGEIAVFEGEQCVGTAVLDSLPVVLTAWEGNKDYGVRGFEAGEPMEFHAWLEEYQQEIIFTSETQHTFREGPYTQVTLTSNPGIIPDQFYLSQNYPNPFNPTTTIPYGLAEASQVTVKLYNLLGQEVWSLSLDQQQPGRHHIIWQGVDQAGKPVASGVYFYRLITDEFSDVKKMVLLR